MYLQPLEGPVGGPNPLPTFPGSTAEQGPLAPGLMPGSTPGDAISRLVPPWITNAMAENPLQNAMVGPLPSLIEQLMQTLQQMMGYGTNGAYGNAGYGTGNAGYGTGNAGYGTGTCGNGSYCPPTGGNEQYFSSANGGSDGDPHLSFNGNTWTTMASQPDLLESASIPGGFQISTQTTAPNAKGVAWNQSATIALNNGATTIEMNNHGQPSIVNYGQAVPISAGQTLQLGSGTSVTCNQNGSLTVTAQNGTGGQITTSLTAKGQGVNVDVSAQNVDLGGSLVNGQQAVQQPTPFGGYPIPTPTPMPSPQPPPVTPPNPLVPDYPY